MFCVQYICVLYAWLLFCFASKAEATRFEAGESPKKCKKTRGGENPDHFKLKHDLRFVFFN